jgi:predicted MFS family arabinose efflux permease
VNPERAPQTLLRTIGTCYVIMLLQGADAFGISYVAPLLGREHGIDPEWVGVIFTASVVGTSIDTSMGGVLLGAGWSQRQLALGIGCVALVCLTSLLAMLRRAGTKAAAGP